MPDFIIALVSRAMNWLSVAVGGGPASRSTARSKGTGNLDGSQSGSWDEYALTLRYRENLLKLASIIASNS
jgi:hypothetical protein